MRARRLLNRVNLGVAFGRSSARLQFILATERSDALSEFEVSKCGIFCPAVSTPGSVGV
jgi:hypothetical protein